MLIWLIVCTFQQYMQFNLSGSNELLLNYSSNIHSAQPETEDYSSLQGILKYYEGRSMQYYTLNPPIGYSVQIYDFEYVGFVMRIDPCRYESTDCCELNSESKCLDYY